MIKAHERRGEIVRNQLYLGGLSGRVYFAPKVRVLADHEDGTGLMSVVGVKHDVTEQFEAVCAERAKVLRAEQPGKNIEDRMMALRVQISKVIHQDDVKAKDDLLFECRNAMLIAWHHMQEMHKAASK